MEVSTLMNSIRIKLTDDCEIMFYENGYTFLEVSQSQGYGSSDVEVKIEKEELITIGEHLIKMAKNN